MPQDKPLENVVKKIKNIGTRYNTNIARTFHQRIREFLNKILVAFSPRISFDGWKIWHDGISTVVTSVTRLLSEVGVR